MKKKNAHGLERRIPEDIKRQIRQRCGFGCVICGFAFYDYEHFSPDFKDAQEHNPEGMTLLCMQCNQKRARKMLSAATVARANENPACKRRGFASESFDIGFEPLEVFFAGSKITGCPTLLRVAGQDILSLRSPTEDGEPFLLSGIFTDKNGRVAMRIEDNSFLVVNNQWDVEIAGPLITIRIASRDIALKLRVLPPNRMVVERINMLFCGWFFSGDSETLKVYKNGECHGQFAGCVAEDCLGAAFNFG